MFCGYEYIVIYMIQVNKWKNIRQIAAWASYDITNTIFFIGVVGIFFPLWVTNDIGGNDATVGFTMSAAMIVSLVLAPFFGTLTDHYLSKVWYLGAFTFIAILAVPLVGEVPFIMALVLYSLSIVCIYLAGIAYNALLNNITTPQNIGSIAGIGVGVGYLGAVLIVVIAAEVAVDSGNIFGFRVSAILMFLASLPALLFLRPKEQHLDRIGLKAIINKTLRDLFIVFVEIKKYKYVSRFMISRFFYTWSLNTAQSFAILFGTETVGYSARHVEYLLLLGILVGIPSAFIWGKLIDLIGAKRSISIAMLFWSICLLLVAIAPSTDVLGNWFWIVMGVFCGALIPGIWVTDRPLMLQITPPEKSGQFFGLHGMVGRIAYITGTFVWGLVVVTLGIGQQGAIINLAICTLIAFIIMQSVTVNKNSG